MHPERFARSDPRTRIGLAKILAAEKGQWRRKRSLGGGARPLPPGPFAVPRCSQHSGRPARGHRHTARWQVFRLRAPQAAFPSRRCIRCTYRFSGWDRSNGLDGPPAQSRGPLRHPIRRRVRGGISPHFPFHRRSIPDPGTLGTRRIATPPVVSSTGARSQAGVFRRRQAPAAFSRNARRCNLR